MRKVPNTIWTRAENGQNPIQKTLSRYLWNPQKTIFWASRNLALEHRFRKPRTAKHKRYSLRCEKSQTPSGHEPKTAKTRSKKLFHVTFGIHKKQPFGPREMWPWNTATESLEQQNTSGSLRCEKSQTQSGHEPKTAKTRSKKLFHVTFGIHKKQSFGPQEHMPSLETHRQVLHWNRSEIVSNSGVGIHFRKPRTAARFVPKVCKTQAGKTLSSNSSKIRAQGMQNTSQKNSFTLPLESKKNSFGPQEHMPSL